MRAALDMVDCPYRLESRTTPRRTGNFARPVRIYQLSVAVKSLAQRLDEQHQTAPASEIAEHRMTVAEMLGGGVRVGAPGYANFAVRVAAPLELPELDLPLDPYVLGAWLGDGTSSSGGFTSVDPEILEHVRAAGFEVHSHQSNAQSHYIRGLMPVLRRLGVLDNKHVPATYLRGSLIQRRALLQGLMDTDGTVGSAGACELSLSDELLAQQALELIRSLGIKASMSTGPGSYRDVAGELVECRDRHRIHFTTSELVFRLPRKAERLPDQVRDTHRWLYITNIQEVAPEPARCISVGSEDRTYLCGEGFVPTSNTSTTHALLAHITQYGWPVWIADGKAIEFLGFRDWPNVQVVASSIEEQVAVIHRAWELMEHRYQLITQGRARIEEFEPLMVFVDEFTDLKANLLSWYSTIKVKGDPSKPATLAELGSLARKGRTSRVHIVMATQRGDAEILTGEMRENFTQRISVGRISPQSAQMMWDNPVTGVTLPREIGRASCRERVSDPV